MEKYFIVTEKSNLHKDYLDYVENNKIVNNLVKTFMQKHEIEANEYIAANTMFCIKSTENDKIKFSKMFIKDKVSGLDCFKKNSSIYKGWIKCLADNSMTILSRPHIALYFKCWGKTSTRLFQIDEVIYCSYSLSGSGEVDTPEGMIEIKASEFFKIIEDYEGRIKS